MNLSNHWPEIESHFMHVLFPPVFVASCATMLSSLAHCFRTLAWCAILKSHTSRMLDNSDSCFRHKIALQQRACCERQRQAVHQCVTLFAIGCRNDFDHSTKRAPASVAHCFRTFAWCAILKSHTSRILENSDSCFHHKIALQQRACCERQRQFNERCDCSFLDIRLACDF